MKSRLFPVLMFLSLVAACRPLEGPTATIPPPVSSGAPLAPLTAIPVATVDQQEVVVTPLPTSDLPTDPIIRQWIDFAHADLGARLGLGSDAIGFVDFATVVWPDGGLGCPHPDLAYPQVQVDGYLIRFVVGKHVYHYHGGDGRGPFLCENGLPAGGGLAP